MTCNRVNALIQTMCRRPEDIERLTRERDAVFDAFRLTAVERAALASGDPMRIVAEGGAHPILAMHWLLLNPHIREQMSILAYPGLAEGSPDG